MRFEWDPQKAQKNLRDHKVSFGTAELVWRDRDRLERHNSFGHGEERREVIGLAGGLTMLFVVYSEPDPDDAMLVRIISARRATAAERRDYDDELDL